MQLGNPVYVVTGERGSGKSTVCAQVARAVADSGLTVAGILTECCDPADPGSARQVVDLRSGERRPFGSQHRQRSRSERPSPTPYTTAQRMVGADPLTPGWDFEPGVFAWASAVLSRATPCDLLVIDEIGPLELLGGRGWVTALHVLRSRAHGSALVVCRPGLLEELRMELVTVPTTLVEVTPQARDYLPAVLLTELRAAIAPSG